MADDSALILKADVKASDGSDVALQVKSMPNGSLLIAANCGDELHEHSFSLGAMDRPLPADYGSIEAQADLDIAVQFATEMAASKSRRGKIISALLAARQ